MPPAGYLPRGIPPAGYLRASATSPLSSCAAPPPRVRSLSSVRLIPLRTSDTSPAGCLPRDTSPAGYLPRDTSARLLPPLYPPARPPPPRVRSLSSVRLIPLRTSDTSPAGYLRASDTSPAGYLRASDTSPAKYLRASDTSSARLILYLSILLPAPPPPPSAPRVSYLRASDMIPPRV